MATAVEVLKRALTAPIVDEDGEEVRLDVFPPMQDVEIDAFAARLPCRLPETVRELLKFARGFEGGMADAVDFSGQLPFAHEDVFPHGLPIASDGFGNFWVADLTASSVDFGPIYFACHDPPVVIFQCDSLGTFLSDLLLGRAGHDNPINFVHEDAAFAIWKRDANAVTRSVALASTDEKVRSLARRVPDGFFIADLRHAATGDGFSWGRFGSKTRILRDGDAPIFAYGPQT